MTTIAHHEPRRVTAGVDTNKDLYVVAVLDDLGRLIDTELRHYPSRLQAAVAVVAVPR